MRISTSQYFETSSASYSQNFANSVKTQLQVSSGTRIQTAADDPIGAAKLLQLQQQSALLTQYSGNMTTITNSLNQEESVLSSVTDSMQRAQELTIQAGNGGISDADRVSISSEIGAIEDRVFSLLNSKDVNGQYLFSGSKTSTPPYVRNGDGSYTYQGDQTQLSLEVSDTLKLATNDTGFSTFEQAVNTSRTQVKQVLTPPAVDDGRVSLSPGRLTSLSSYNRDFSAGQPYTLKFTDSTHYSITNASGPVANGVFDPAKSEGLTISLRGVDFDFGIHLQDTDTDADAAIAGHVFSLESKPDNLVASRSAGNASTAQVTGSAITDPALYSSTFPASGMVIKFTSATTYDIYAQPLTDNSKSIASVPFSGTQMTAAGVTFDLSAAPQLGDQFSVQVNSHTTQSVLDTLSQLRVALTVPITDAASALNLKNATDSALGNLSSASERIDITRGLIGARGNSIDIQQQENVSLNLANKSTQSAIADTDLSTASIALTLQQTMLQASQLAFAKISQLSLFNKL